MNHTCVFCVSNYHLACYCTWSYPTTSRDKRIRTPGLPHPKGALCQPELYPCVAPAVRRGGNRASSGYGRNRTCCAPRVRVYDPVRPVPLRRVPASAFKVRRGPARRRGLEPLTFGFGDRCSTTELPLHALTLVRPKRPPGKDRARTRTGASGPATRCLATRPRDHCRHDGYEPPPPLAGPPGIEPGPPP